MFINGLVTNIEAWNFLSVKNIKILEDADSRLFATIFESLKSTNRVLYYLETGTIPIRYILSKRVLMYYFHILSRPKDELIRKCYEAMKLKTVRHDWYARIQSEKSKHNITLSDDEVQQMSKGKFKSYVDQIVDSFAFSKLLDTAKQQSKCKSILLNMNQVDLKIQKYLISEHLVKEEQSLLFSLRTYSFPVKSNFSYLYSGDMKRWETMFLFYL